MFSVLAFWQDGTQEQEELKKKVQSLKDLIITKKSVQMWEKGLETENKHLQMSSIHS